MSQSARQSDVEVAGGRLAAFELNGGGGAPLVVAVHGITATSHAWVPVARELAGSARVLAPDLRGRGRSAGLPAPYGVGAHVADLLALLDHLGAERAVFAGHSLGAYIVARLAADHPDRVAGAVLVDGGLTIPQAGDVDPQEFVEGFLGPALARLKLRFATAEEYVDWWRAHPAMAGGAVEDADLVAYARHDLAEAEPELRSSVAEAAVRGDAAELFELGEAAHRLALPATLLCAPRGLLDEPHPMQPAELVRAWAQEDPGRRRWQQIADVNHYTIILGPAGARAVAAEITAAIATDRASR